MRLVRCDGCGRHVRVEDSECPFCGAAHAAPALADNAFLRVSRAAVFAGAAVVGGCWTSSPSPSTAPPPPPTDTTQQSFATSPPGEGTGSLSGLIADKSNQPLVNVGVAVFAGNDYSDGKAPFAVVMTDANGAYELPGLAPGTYTMAVQVGVRPAWPHRQVSVRDGERALVNVNVKAPGAVPVPHPIPAPYGAPPARRRVV